MNLSEVVFKKTIETENRTVLVSSNPIDEKALEEATEFSDFNIIIPTLFNLYHGFELVLKGFLLIKKDVATNHKIEKLYSDFKSEFSDQKEIFIILDKYILIETMIEPLKTFFDKNSISTNFFHEAFRYPATKDFIKKYEHLDLLYKDKEGIPFFRDTVKNLSKFKVEVVKLGKTFEM